ncbi:MULTISPECIES: DUF5130 family protein [unclassified Frankia]
MATGEPFTHEQLDRLNRARELAETHTGIHVSIRIGAVRGDARLAAERILANLVDDAGRDAAVLILVSPGQRFVRIATTPAAKKRIGDSAAGLAALTMASSFALGGLVGGLIAGIRQLADAAGGAGGAAAGTLPPTQPSLAVSPTP